MFFTQQNHSASVLSLNYKYIFLCRKIILQHMTAYNSILMSHDALFNLMDIISLPFFSASKSNASSDYPLLMPKSLCISMI